MPQIRNSKAWWINYKRNDNSQRQTFDYLGYDEVDDKWQWIRQNFQNPFNMLCAG